MRQFLCINLGILITAFFVASTSEQANAGSPRSPQQFNRWNYQQQQTKTAPIAKSLRARAAFKESLKAEIAAQNQAVYVQNLTATALLGVYVGLTLASFALPGVAATTLTAMNATPATLGVTNFATVSQMAQVVGTAKTVYSAVTATSNIIDAVR